MQPTGAIFWLSAFAHMHAGGGLQRKKHTDLNKGRHIYVVSEGHRMSLNLASFQSFSSPMRLNIWVLCALLYHSKEAMRQSEWKKRCVMEGVRADIENFLNPL